MSDDGNIRQEFNAIERDFFTSEESPNSALDDSSAPQIKKPDGTSRDGVETGHIDLEDNNTYVQLIPSLEDMATLAATLETLHHHYSQNYYDYFKNANNVIDKLMVPNLIRAKMAALCAEMQKEIHSLRFKTDWHGLDRPILRLHDMYYDDDSYFYIYILVWDSNGHIDDKKTIEKAISCSKYSNEGDFMFEMITKYCLEDYIKDFPLDSLSEEFIRAAEADKLQKYWITDKRRVTLDGEDAYNVSAALISFLDSLKSSSSVYQWSTYEYFWDYFDEDDQTEIAMNLIRDESYKRYQKILLSKLNKNQLKQLYSEAPLPMIVSFAFLREFEIAKAVWDRIKLTIECDDYEVILDHVWKNGTPDDESCMEFLIYSWNTAPLNFIEYMMNEKNCQIANKLIDGGPMLESSGRFEFLKAVLSRTTPEFRRRYLQHAGTCLSLNQPDVFSSLIDHCLNETDRVTVKENILLRSISTSLLSAGILHRCRDLLYSNRDEFNKFLELFTLKPTLQTRFKECLLESKLLVTNVLWKAEHWQTLSQFIDELYPNREVARYQKRKVVFTFLRTRCNYRDCYHPNGDEKFTEIDNLLTQVLTPREIITAKENIGDSFLKACRSRGLSSLKRMNLQRFATWCYCGDEYNIKRFRRSLPMDKLFRSLLSQVVERYVNGRDVTLSFSSLDELIRWKFSSKRSEMKKFKSREINRIMTEKVEESFKWKTHKYPSVLKKVIEWGFDGDRRQIREFEQRYSESDRMKIIHWMYLWEETTDCAKYYHHTSDDSDSGRRRRLHTPLRLTTSSMDFDGDDFVIAHYRKSLTSD
ncbi:uncharacterized protein LOC135840797 [Planococcus citri]|uniref:uncharacterized protein LOC135840797 n=1 Tax=Planococcus citri TaxID=170843 RepID=UPI0031F80E8F